MKVDELTARVEMEMTRLGDFDVQIITAIEDIDDITA